VLGTVNYRFGGKVYPADHTTPESVDLQRLFSEMLEAGVTDVVMEVSSHAISQGRIQGVHFDAVAFTNLSQDHLDYYPDLEDYFQAKKDLFTQYLPASSKPHKIAVLNFEDPRSESLFDKIAGDQIKKLRVGLTGPYEVSCKSFEISAEGIKAHVVHHQNDYQNSKSSASEDSLVIRSQLMGRHNLENILVAIGLTKGLGIPPEAISRGIQKMRSISGRLERVENDRGLHIFVDYAHTPDALARVGQSLKGLKQGVSSRLITVFGCGGDRDRSKRPLMGREAGLVSDIVILTSDNPRSEDPEAIIKDILPGLESIRFPKDRTLKIISREEALHKALEVAREGDFILIAGKGHENYQIIGKEKRPFSDQEILRRILTEGDLL
jgi:UDP-N-acetylmuramoyl-L-alanyl-D-glutamate--2,6-diaminopimelate ligase